MKPGMVYRIIHRETCILSIPVMGTIAVAAGAVVFNSRSHFIFRHPLIEIPTILWILFGILMGAGLIARDRRTGISITLLSLPLNPVIFTAIRFLFRLILVTAVCAMVLALKYLFDISFNQSMDPAYFKVIYRNVPGLFRNALTASVFGFTLASSFSCAVRREMLAVGGTFVSIVALGVVFLGILLVHPKWYTIMQIALWYLIPSTWIFIIFMFFAILWASAGLDLESSTARRRIFIMVSTGICLSGVYWACQPMRHSQTRFSEVTRLYGMKPVPLSSDVLVESFIETSKGSIPGGIWRLGPRGAIQAGDSVIFFIPSPDGRFLATVEPADSMFKIQERSVNLRDINGKVISHANFMLGHHRIGQWSPDSRYLALPVQKNLQASIVLLPSDPGKPTISWKPDLPSGQSAPFKTIFPAGWLDPDSLVCCSWIAGSRGVTFWIADINGTFKKIWEGNMWPSNVNMIAFWDNLTVAKSRNSVFCLKEHEGSRYISDLIEIHCDEREPEKICEIPANTRIRMDTEEKILHWYSSDPESGSMSTRYHVMDLETRSTQTIILPHSFDPQLSPDGKYIAASLIEETPGDEKPLILLDFPGGQEIYRREGIREVVWLDSGRLAILSNENTVEHLDPALRQTERVLIPERGEKNP